METDSACIDNQLQRVFGCMTSSGVTGDKQFPKSLSPSRFQEPPGVPEGLLVPSCNMRIHITMIFRETHAPTAEVEDKNDEKQRGTNDPATSCHSNIYTVCSWPCEAPPWRGTLWGVNGFFSMCWHTDSFDLYSAGCCMQPPSVDPLKGQKWSRSRAGTM